VVVLELSTMSIYIRELEMSEFLRELADDGTVPTRISAALKQTADELDRLTEAADRTWRLEHDLAEAEAEAAFQEDMRSAILDYDRGIIDRAELVKAAR
jgi:hypothetical protein